MDIKEACLEDMEEKCKLYGQQLLDLREKSDHDSEKISLLTETLHQRETLITDLTERNQ